jgi:hypothetical protein
MCQASTGGLFEFSKKKKENGETKGFATCATDEREQRKNIQTLTMCSVSIVGAWCLCEFLPFCF